MSRMIKAINTYRCDVATFEQKESDQYYLFRISERDEHGRVIYEKELLQNGRPNTEIHYTYQDGAEGKLLSKQTDYLQEGTSERLEYSYNDQGQVTEEVLYFNDEVYEKTLYELNAKGDVMAFNRIDSDDNLVEKQQNEYNDEGKIVRQLLTNSEGDVEHELRRKYNEKGLIAEEENYYPDQGWQRNKFYFNDKDERIRSEIYDGENKLVGEVEVEYDSGGKPVKYTSNTSGYRSSHMINQITYDDEGRIIENEYYDVMNGFLLSKEMVEFDDNGNIAKEELFEVHPNAGMKKNHFRVQHQYDYYETDKEALAGQ